MDSFYGNSYQTNGGEKDFQKLAQLIGTNIQKISQNGKNICNVFWRSRLEMYFYI